MKLGAIATILLLCSRVLAESQESVYYEALKAEEQGQVSKSIELFERAASIDGPYTDEIREILDAYYQALGMDEPSLSFRLRSDISVLGIHYEESGGYEKINRNGGETFFGLSLFADHSSGTKMHSFGLNFSGNVFVGDTITPLDSAQWTMIPGVEYNFLKEDLSLSAGIDFKFNAEEWRPLLYGWLEKKFIRLDKDKFGAVISATEEWDVYSEEWEYRFVASVLVSWRRFSTRGFNTSCFFGARFTAEDMFDYDAWLQRQQYQMFLPAEENGDYYPKYNVRWLGPYLRGRFSYKFRYNFTTEFSTNLFYGLVVDGPNSNYEKMTKFTGLWGPTLYWSPNIMTFYIGVENAFRRYFDIPDSYEELLSDSMSLWELKLGLKIDW